MPLASTIKLFFVAAPFGRSSCGMVPLSRGPHATFGRVRSESAAVDVDAGRGAVLEVKAAEGVVGHPLAARVAGSPGTGRLFCRRRGGR
jgi:hypothetical protein